MWWNSQLIWLRFILRKNHQLIRRRHAFSNLTFSGVWTICHFTGEENLRALERCQDLKKADFFFFLYCLQYFRFYAKCFYGISACNHQNQAKQVILLSHQIQELGGPTESGILVEDRAGSRREHIFWSQETTALPGGVHPLGQPNAGLNITHWWCQRLSLTWL